MKKILLCSCVVLSLYSCTDTDVITFYGLVTIIGGILGIILFFKVWGMTNDVRALRQHFIPETTATAPDYKAGMQIYINSLNEKATIVEVNTSTVKVKLASGKTTETDLSDLTPID